MDGLALNWFAFGEDELCEIGLGGSREDIGDMKLKTMGRGKISRVRVAGFPEFVKTRADGIGLVRRFGVLDPEVFPTTVVRIGSEIIQAKVIKREFRAK